MAATLVNTKEPNMIGIDKNLTSEDTVIYFRVAFVVLIWFTVHVHPHFGENRDK